MAVGPVNITPLSHIVSIIPDASTLLVPGVGSAHWLAEGWQKVEDEAQEVEEKNQGQNPFNDGGSIRLILPAQNTKS